MKYILRGYQQEALDLVEIGKKQVIYNPIRSGKSLVLRTITNKFKNSKILVLTDNRKIVEQLMTYFKDEATFVMSGKKLDLTKRVMIGSYQTLANRPEVDLNSFNICMRDECHKYHSNKLVKHLREIIPTIVDFSGTPIDNKGVKLKGYDKWIRTITIKEMFEQNYLSPVIFKMSSNFLQGKEAELNTKKQDYDECVVEQLLDKTSLLENVKNDIIEEQIHLKHKTLMYTISISMGEKMLAKLNLPNVKMVHSKMTSKEIQKTMEWFKVTEHCILLNCKMLTLGFDDKNVDYIISISPTKIRSLFMQRVLRQATYKEGKQGYYRDYVGDLARFDPYDDDFNKKVKDSCSKKCKEFEIGSLEYHMCMQGCKDNELGLVFCRAEPSQNYKDNPYNSNFKLVRGQECKIGSKFYEWSYKTTEPKNGQIGKLLKWRECPSCGAVYVYELTTMTEPSQAIELYKPLENQNKITCIYSKEPHKLLMIIEDTKLKSYRYKLVESQQELYSYALQHFKNRKFTLTSNIPLDKLANVKVDKSLSDYIPAIDYTKEKQGIMRKIIKLKVLSYLEQFGMNKHYAYYFMKVVNSDNEKQVITKLNEVYDKYALMDIKNKLEKVVNQL